MRFQMQFHNNQSFVWLQCTAENTGAEIALFTTLIQAYC